MSDTKETEEEVKSCIHSHYSAELQQCPNMPEDEPYLCMCCKECQEICEEGDEEYL